MSIVRERSEGEGGLLLKRIGWSSSRWRAFPLTMTVKSMLFMTCSQSVLESCRRHFIPSTRPSEAGKVTFIEYLLYPRELHCCCSCNHDSDLVTDYSRYCVVTILCNPV